MLIGCADVSALRSPVRCGDLFSSTCGVLPSCRDREINALDGLVAKYIQERLPWKVRERLAWEALEREVALRRAAYGRDPWGAKHPHQYRLTDKALRAGVRLALERRDLFFGATEFETNLALACEIQHQIFGLGEMWSYDFAQRFSAHLRVTPVYVHVQRGARVGARNLGLPVVGGRVLRTHLPEELCVLDSDDVEDFLCITKARLNRSMLRRTER